MISLLNTIRQPRNSLQIPYNFLTGRTARAAIMNRPVIRSASPGEHTDCGMFASLRPNHPPSGSLHYVQHTIKRNGLPQTL